ncbi:membrane protein insertion efficiency factor YidD [Synergistaceae bacterium OttesenSCG-928-D05]|nr:membrane protein insertion efficiency factor YidD [Synergistaceae bacterium OttesenSCG-928-D05]
MSLASKFGVFFVRFYQTAISPVLGGGKCRFYPTCSDYATEAFREYGFFYGAQLGLRRFLRCGPWSPGGYDPVPGPEEMKRWIWIGKF